MNSLVRLPNLSLVLISNCCTGKEPNKIPNEQIYKDVYTDAADWVKNETLTFWREEMARIAPLFPHNSKSAQSDTQALIKDVNKLVSSTLIQMNFTYCLPTSRPVFGTMDTQIILFLQCPCTLAWIVKHKLQITLSVELKALKPFLTDIQRSGSFTTTSRSL